MVNYREEAKRDARKAFEFSVPDAIDSLLANGELWDDLLDPQYHYENHLSRGYSLTQAGAILDELTEFVATDPALWNAMAPRDAVSFQAAVTYGNAVHAEFDYLVKQVNDAWGKQELEEDSDEAEIYAKRLIRAVMVGAPIPDTVSAKDWKPGAA